jgi:DNA-binding MarR family transcriptional regulator
MMDFDKLVHQPTRLRIFAHLYANGETSFTDLTEELDATGGNLSRHLQKMEDAECVAIEKQFVDRTPQTTYHLTDTGREKFESHVRTLETLVDDLDV